MQKTYAPMTKEEKKVILASSAGTVFEWYDFFLYGSLATVIGDQFFSAFPETTRNVFALLAFAVGFLVRPLGALIFGRLGDSVGRKYTFLVTILIMGISTFAVGFLPNYATIGVAAPIILITLRILQGLALGGEYGGAVTYVAEHAPQNRRGFFTSWIQTTATLGLLLSILIIIAVRSYVGEVAFADWGWRVPFLFSILLLGISVYVRMQLQETPAFQKLKESGRQSQAPVMEAFGQWKNLKYVLAGFLGLAAGHTVIWYAAQIYMLVFLKNIVQVDAFTINILIAWALILGAGGFVFFGALSDKIGRKKLILFAYAVGIVTLFPLFRFIAETANPQLYAAQETAQVILLADKNDCSFQFNPVGTAKFTNSCDVARTQLAKNSVNYRIEYMPGTVPAKIRIGETEIASYDLKMLNEADKKKVANAFVQSVDTALGAAGYPVAKESNTGLVKVSGFLDIFRAQVLKLIAAMTLLVLIAAAAYAPIAAAFVELFPTRIRYTAMALPYNLGAGWFGGLMPATAFAMAVHTGNVYYGLWYPVVVAAMGFIVVLFFIPENTNKDIFADD
ncbi:MAG: MFS transporter [Pseudomonadota bacterium]